MSTVLRRDRGAWEPAERQQRGESRCVLVGLEKKSEKEGKKARPGAVARAKKKGKNIALLSPVLGADCIEFRDF